jgi:uncharacterized protein (DUF2249 family)
MTTHNLDNRGLQPPEPMVRILGSLQQLANGDELVVLMDREPLLLYPELERRGFRWECAPQEQSFVLTIRNAVPA